MWGGCWIGVLGDHGNFNPPGFALFFFFNLAGRLEENMLNYLMPQLVQNDKNMI